MSSKKRYCIFTAQYLPHLGGVERYTYNLAKKLIEKGNEVVIVTSNVYKLAEFEVMDGIPVYRLPCLNLLAGRYPVLKPTKVFRKINKALKEQHFDMVIVNTRFYFHSLYGMLFAKKKGIKCITIEHGTGHLSVHNKFFDKIGSIFEHILTAIDKRLCKDYYGVSKACNEWVKHFGITAKGVLYNSIDVNDIAELSNRRVTDYRKQHNIPQSATVITFTGRLLKEKGLPQLLNVADKLCKEQDDLYLFIAGDGDMEEEVNRRGTDRIIPLGRIDYEHIAALLNDTDIFCLPTSYAEGLPTSVLEAAACKCYCVTTARGGAKELLLNEQYGSVIENNDEDILYAELKRVINDKPLRKAAVEKTFNELKDNFTWETVAKRVENICCEGASK